jgi:hypothetical protein
MMRAASTCVVLLLSAQAGLAQTAAVEQPAAPAGSPSVVLLPVTPNQDDLLLFELLLGQLQVSDAMPGYQVGDQVYLPVSELARLLDLAIAVSTVDRRITGSVGEARRPVFADLKTGDARADSRAIRLPPGSAIAGLSDIYLTPEALALLLPLDLKVNAAELRIEVVPREKLPIEERLDRLARLRQLRGDGPTDVEVLDLDVPYRFLTAPAFDVSLETATDTRDPKFPRRYDVRIGSDALWTNFQGYFGSDNAGRPSNARMLFERRNPKGGLLGLTRFSAGDTFTPALSMGARSIGGRGVSISSRPLEEASVFERIDLRGELPLGFDVELYVNDVLRGGQETPVQGRYEFLNVPLVRGPNVIRIVTYGPRGERTEETRVIAVGGGALPKGEFQYDFGIAQQDKPVLDLREQEDILPTVGQNDLRVTGSIGYGISEALTAVGGFAIYTPTGEERRTLGTVGLRTSLLGFATQLDAAGDDSGGYGVALGLAGQPFGVSSVIRHGEYRSGFIDEALPRGGDGRGLERYSEIGVDFALTPFGTTSIPLSLRAQREQFSDGAVGLTGAVRASTSIDRVFVSGGVDYTRTMVPGSPSTEQMTGVFSASTFLGFAWQLRASLDYDILPSLSAQAFTFTADRDLDEKSAVRFGIGQSLTESKSSSFQAGYIRRFRFGDVSLSGDYTAPNNDWRIGLQMAFSVLFDPLNRRYTLARPGAASGGNVALRAFVDRNSNDRFDAGEDPVPNVVIGQGLEQVRTNENGIVLATGLGYAASATIQTNLEEVDFPYFIAPPQTIRFVPRQGRVAVIDYPLKPTGEALVRVVTKIGERRQGLSAVRLRLEREGEPTVDATTEFDGSFVFDRLTAGKYRISLDPQQAERLAMSAVAPLEFEIPPDGGFAGNLILEVKFTKTAER